MSPRPPRGGLAPITSYVADVGETAPLDEEAAARILAAVRKKGGDDIAWMLGVDDYPPLRCGHPWVDRKVYRANGSSRITCTVCSAVHHSSSGPV